LKLPRRLIGVAMLGAVAGLPACALPPDAPTVLASANGTGPSDAYVVISVAQEYEILRLLGLESQGQEFHLVDGQPYDVIHAVDPQTQETRDVWFDISRFSGRI
jgi:hypothetical protein